MIAMLRPAVAVCAVGVSESVTTTVKLVGPTKFPFGVPLITPALLKIKPAGRLLPDANFQVSAPTPPFACSVWLPYTLFMVPPGSDDVVTLSAGALTAMLRPAGVAAGVGVSTSVTVTVKGMGPVASPVGVPEITPALLKVKPAGKVPGGTLHV